MNVDVIIPILKRDLRSFLYAYPYILKNLPVKNIILIGSSDIQTEIQALDHITLINENDIADGLTLGSIRKLKKELSGNESRAGWYFQQFLKMAYARYTDEDYYLIWDADTIPINKIEMFDKSGKPYLAYRDIVKEDKCYEQTQETILTDKALKKQEAKSFIAEHMLVKTEIMKDLLDRIEENKNINGYKFFDKIMNCVPQRYINLSGFSEFELYAAFVLKYYPDTYVQRKWKNLRNAKIYVGSTPDTKDIQWINKVFDVISLEDFDSYWFLCRIIKLADKKRKHIPFITIHTLISPFVCLWIKIRFSIRDLVKR